MVRAVDEIPATDPAQSSSSENPDGLIVDHQNTITVRGAEQVYPAGSEIDHSDAYAALCTAWHAANDLKMAWASAPIAAQQQFVADVLGIVDRR